MLANFILAVLFLQSGNGGFPAITADSGIIHVVWQDDPEGNHEIYYSHSTESGSFIKPLNISRNDGVSDLPRIAVHENSVGIVWSDTSSGHYQVMLAESDDGGTTFGSSRVLSDGKASTGPPDIASQNGRWFVVWDETEEDTGESHVEYWDSENSRRRIAGSTRGFVPAIAVRNRRIVIAWHTDIDYKQRVYAVQSDDLGTSFSEPVLISADFQRSVTPSVSIAPSGRAFIAWSDRTSGPSDLFLASSDKDAKSFSPPKTIAAPARESIFPSIQALDDDEIGVVWLSRISIHYERISAAGDAKEPARTLTTSDTAGVPRLAMSGGVPIVVWMDSRGGTAEILVSKDRGRGVPIAR